MKGEWATDKVIFLQSSQQFICRRDLGYLGVHLHKEAETIFRGNKQIDTHT